MRKRHARQAFAPIGSKECWHPYGLQSLGPEKFIHVVNSIIQGEHRVLPVRKSQAQALTVFKPMFPDSR